MFSRIMLVMIFRSEKTTTNKSRPIWVSVGKVGVLEWSRLYCPSINRLLSLSSVIMIQLAKVAVYKVLLSGQYLWHAGECEVAQVFTGVNRRTRVCCHWYQPCCWNWNRVGLCVSTRSEMQCVNDSQNGWNRTRGRDRMKHLKRKPAWRAY